MLKYISLFLVLILWNCSLQGSSKKMQAEINSKQHTYNTNQYSVKNNFNRENKSYKQKGWFGGSKPWQLCLGLIGSFFSLTNATCTSSISAGYYHNCIISNETTTKCWGYNIYGQLGYGDTNNRGDGPNEMGDYLPVVDLGSSFVVQNIALGYYHTCALSIGGEIKCWGYNNYGQLGYGDTNNRGDVSNEMGDNLPVVDLVTNTCAPSLAPTYSPTDPTLVPTGSPTKFPSDSPSIDYGIEIVCSILGILGLGSCGFLCCLCKKKEKRKEQIEILLLKGG